MLWYPSGAAAHYLHMVAKCLHVVVVCRVRRSELYGHVGRAECLAIEILLIVHIYDADYLVPTAQGYLLYHVAHLAVAYQCYLHNVLLYI